MENENQAVESKKSPALWIIILILILGAAGYLIYKFEKGKENSKNNVSTQNVASQQNVTQKSDNVKTEDNISGTCATELTSTDKSTIESWKTYSNIKYNYSFKYPGDWNVQTQEDDQLTIVEESEKVTFAVRSAEMSALGYEGYKSDSKKDIKISCIDTSENFLSGDPNAIEGGVSESNKLILAQFTRNDIPFLLTLNYEDMGASLSGDIIDAWNLILKSFEFK